MIVLDEQLLGYGLSEALGRWYRGTITGIRQLRPHSAIFDEAIPELLRSVRQPAFVTINVADFWRRLIPDQRFGIFCFALPDRRVAELPDLLRRTFAVQPFRTRRGRLGKIVRVTTWNAQYYTTDSWALQTVDWSGKRKKL